MGKNFTSLASFTVTFMTALSIATPIATPMAYASDPSMGDAAATLPDEKVMCDQIKAAQAGNLTDASGKPVTFTLPSCAGFPAREREEPKCQGSLAAVAGGDASITQDSLCSNTSTLPQATKSYCNMRTLVKTTQAGQYCEAYDSASAAEKGVTATAALDAAAAGICWAEALSMKALRTKLNVAIAEKNICLDKCAAANKGAPCSPSQCPLHFSVVSAMGPGSIFNSGICGGAAMAAGAGELIQTTRMLATGGHSAGSSSIDSDNNVQSRSNTAKIVEVVASAGLSLKAVQLGICYYSPKTSICNGVNNIDVMREGSASASKLNSAQKTRTVSANTLEEETPANAYAKDQLVKDKAALEDAKTGNNTSQGEAAGFNDDDYEYGAPDPEQIKAAEQTVTTTEGIVKASTASLSQAQAALDKSVAAAKPILAAFGARANLAQQAALLFTGLTAMRAISLISASSTKGKAKTILQSMFAPGGAGTTFGSSGISTVGSSNYAVTAGSTFASPTGTGANTSAAISAGSPEAFLLPPGSKQNALATSTASRIPASAVQSAAAGGASGVGGLIGSVASSMGGGDTAAINRMVASTFANLPQDSGSGYSGSGGSSKLGKSDSGSGMDLNLKGLFGGGDKEEKSASNSDLAYRGLASDDIWHSHNPKGNNLFQIISDRYDTAQRKQPLSP
jgi:hypothetical protein